MRRRPDDRPLSPEIGGRVDSRGQGLENPADHGVLGKGPYRGEEVQPEA